jgi:hypothetical protein
MNREAETLPRFFLDAVEAPALAFFAQVGNNPVVILMRLAYGLAIALWLSFPFAGMASWRQDAASPANPAGQAPAAPAAPAENTPARQIPAETTPIVPVNPQTPAAEQKKAPESVAKKKKASGPASGTSGAGTRKRRKRTASAREGAPRKIVVREGGAVEPAAQMAPGITPAEATRQRQNAERLLGSADDRLKQLAGRTLDARQQETVGQIRNYVDGARSALKESDVRRANTLAEKAHLLAEDLVKHYK